MSVQSLTEPVTRRDKEQRTFHAFSYHLPSGSSPNVSKPLHAYRTHTVHQPAFRGYLFQHISRALGVE